MAGERILIVEDEPSFVEALVVGLGREEFVVDVATDGFAALERFAAETPDLVLLDVMLPGQSGIDVCRQIRAISNVPVIMVTARDSELDTVIGLEVGADDYVSKPYRMRELVARIRAQLRRTSNDTGTIEAPVGDRAQRFEVGQIVLDIDRHEVTRAGEPVPMPLKEFQVLQLLLENVGRVVRRDDLITKIWGEDYVGDTKTLDVHVKRLRSKLEVDPSAPRHIVTVRGVGYRFVH